MTSFPKNVIGYRKDKWAADHCIDSRLVPGVLLTNRRIIKDDPALSDMAPTILSEFGIEQSNEMHGKNVFEKRQT